MSNKFCQYSMALFFAATVVQPLRVAAQDASFGCKVFMCVSAGNWQAIPYCVPHVQMALMQAAMGVPWPICPEAIAGAASQAFNQGNDDNQN